MTEVERYVRDRVAATGEPCLMQPPGREPSLLAVPMWKHFAEEPEGVYVLVTGISVPNGLEAWAVTTRSALATVESRVAEPVEGIAYRYEESACDSIRHVEASALGLSLLQLALNRAGSGLGLVCA